MRNLELPKRKDFVIYPTHDFGFKALMGHKLDSDNTLIKDFLKALFNKEFNIIEFKDREITPSHILGKTIRLDLRVQCEGVLVNIEMQMFPTGNEADRALYYACKSIESQAMEGKNYDELIPVCQIILMAKSARDLNSPVAHYQLLNTQTGVPLTDKLKLSMIGLDGVVDSIDDVSQMTDLQKWALFLSCGHQLDHEAVQVLLKEERFRKAEMIMRIVNEDEMLKDAAFQRMKDELDRNTRTHYELKQARAEGIELGKAQTEMKYVFEMIKKGLDVQLISEVSGLSIEQIRKIQAEMC